MNTPIFKVGDWVEPVDDAQKRYIASWGGPPKWPAEVVALEEGNCVYLSKGLPGYWSGFRFKLSLSPAALNTPLSQYL